MSSKRQILENIKRLIGYAALVIIVLSTSTKLMATERYLPLGDGDSIITYDGIPFDLDGPGLSVLKTGDEFGGTPEFRPIDTIDLSGYIANRIHLLEAAAFATNVPNGVTVGTIRVYYDDGGFDDIELTMGQNIAEWAYDRPENQCCLAHNKVTPAYSDLTNIDSQYDYLEHLFYVYIDTQDKPLDYLELSLHEASYTGQPDCPQACVYYHGLENWFAISIDAITLESSVEPIIIGFWGAGPKPPGRTTLGNIAMERLAVNLGLNPKKDMFVPTPAAEGRAKRKLFKILDTDNNKILSHNELRFQRIRLFGYSMGGMAALSMANDISQPGGEVGGYMLDEPIPIETLVTIDPVRPLGGNMPSVPGNVVNFQNYYQSRGGSIFRSFPIEEVILEGNLFSNLIQSRFFLGRSVDPLREVQINMDLSDKEVVVDWTDLPPESINQVIIRGNEVGHDAAPFFVLDDAFGMIE